MSSSKASGRPPKAGSWFAYRDPELRKDLSGMNKLFTELGLAGKAASDKYLIKLFKTAMKGHAEAFLKNENLTPEDIKTWKDEKCRKACHEMAKKFFIQHGPRYWPKKPIPANTKGYRHDEHDIEYGFFPFAVFSIISRALQLMQSRIVRILKQLFYQHVNNRRREDRERAKVARLNVKPNVQSAPTNHYRDIGYNVETAIDVDEIVNYGFTERFNHTPEPEVPKYLHDPGLPSPGLPPAVGGESNESIPPILNRDLGLSENCDNGDYIHVATRTIVNEQGKRPARTEVEEAQQRAKSPRQGQDDSLGLHMYHHNDDNESSFTPSDEEPLYNVLAGRQKRRTRGKDYTCEGSELEQSTPAPRTRFGTVEPAVPVSYPLPDFSSVEAPIAPMVNEASMAVPILESHGDSTLSQPGEAPPVASPEENPPEFEDDSGADIPPQQFDEATVTSTATKQAEPEPEPATDTSSDTAGPKVSPSAKDNLLQDAQPEPQQGTQYTRNSASSISDTHLFQLYPRFTFIVYQSPSRVRDWDFTGPEFFQMKLADFVAVLPMQDKKLLEGLSIIQQGPSQVCLHHVMLDDKTRFDAIREDFASCIREDMEKAIKDGPRLHFEITIKPIRWGMAE
ncbi:hypothetical protein F66182_129 [Fusarium sp. NRRL 66182]|nr:hypothetical protein F66182_129 [Fusarium sp. NRRL 66182]